VVGPIKHQTTKANGIDVHYLSAGDPASPLIMFLHGFPEFSGAWCKFLTAFSRSHFAVAPDQRGFNLTSKPQDVAAYSPRVLAADMIALIDELSPRRKVTLVGHDWGATIAYSMAFRVPQRIERLVVLNGVHPIPYLKALISKPEQLENSAYIDVLRAPDAAAVLGARECAPLLELLSSYSDMTWLTPEKKALYLKAWKQPGALNAMCNWYRAMSILPDRGQSIETLDFPNWNEAELQVRMPHMLIWGMKDMVLLPETYTGLDDYCTDLVIHEFPDADHWVLHQQTDEIVDLIKAFLS